MGFMLADRALIWCTICIFLNVSLYSLLPKRLGDRKHRLEFAQRVTSSLHAIWMFTGAVHCWAFGKCTLNNGADIFKGYTRIAELSPLIDDRIDHMLGYLIADQALDILIDLMKSNWSVFGMLRANAFATTVHHVLGMVVHVICRHYNHGLFALYTSGVYLAEGSTPFLNASWIMKSVGLDHTFLFAVNGTLLVLNFFVFRILIPPLLLHHWATTNLDSWEDYPSEYIMRPLTGFTLFIFMMLNFMWFYTLVQLFVKGIRQISKKNKE